MNLSFRLRTLLLGIACFACLLAWRSYNVKRIAAMRAAIDRAEQALILVDDETQTDYLGLTFSQVPNPKTLIILEDAQPDALCLEIAAGVFDSVEKVLAVRSVLGRNHLAAFARLPRLKDLGVNHNEFCDDDLKCLSDCRLLEKIYLSGVPISDAGIAHLRNLPNLRTLQLRETNVRGDNWDRLRFLSVLEDLDVSFTPFAEAGFNAISQPNIKKLVLADVPVDRAAARAIGQMTKLEELYLGETEITDAGIAELLGLRRLRLIHLNATPISDEGVEKLATLPSLRTLNASSTGLRGKCFGSAWRQSGLETLDVRGCPITSAGWECIARLPELKNLYAGNGALDDRAAQILAGAPRLRSLRIHGASITDAGLAALLHNPGLTYIGVQGTMITREFARKAAAEHGRMIEVNFESPTGVMKCIPADQSPLPLPTSNQTSKPPTVVLP